ncbi:hypothetical protein HY045_02810, partial [Candidatus Woesebacteria bacterium]|nr:hypothetical protein [Candidatus Woesebacteria bacterium]
MPKISLNLLTKAINLNFGNFEFSPAYWEAGLIIFLVFLLVLSMAQFRRHLLDWSLKGAGFGIAFGFMLALVLEGFLLLSGKTALIEVLGWKNAPKPIVTVLDMGKAQLIKVLGASDIKMSLADEKKTS